MKHLTPLTARLWEAKAAKAGRGRYGFDRGSGHTHRGVDAPAPRGTPVRATMAGTVTHAANQLGAHFSGYGRHVVVRTQPTADHPQAWLLFAHLESADVKPGDVVKAASVIGTVGDSCFERGNPSLACKGTHLHFEVSPTPYPQDSEAPRLDPLAWLAGASPDVATSKARSGAPRPLTSKRQNGTAIGAVVTLAAGLAFTILMLRRRRYT